MSNSASRHTNLTNWILFLIGLCLPAVCWADAKSDYLNNLKGKNEVPAILSRNSYPCEMMDAFAAGKGQVETDGQKETVQIYEVVCKSQKGVLLRVDDKGRILYSTDCYEAEFRRRMNKDAPICILPGNKNSHQWIEPWVKPLFPNCQIHVVLYAGKAPEGAGDIYEVACKGGYSGGSGFYTLPNSGMQNSGRPLSYVSCLRAQAGETKCVRTDPKGAVNNFKPLAETALKGCAPSDARFLGGSKEKLFYEIQCDTRDGFVVITDRFDQFQSALTCTDASKYGASCKFDSTTPKNLRTAEATNASASRADLAAYTSRLAGLGKVCTVGDANVIGHDKALARELIEFKCQENPYGLAGYIPINDGQGGADLTDCFIATLRKFDCRFYPVQAQKKRIEELASESEQIKADCEISDIRFIGANAEQDLTVEIACKNKRGYIAVIGPTREGISRALPCRVAANREGWEKCTLPENGTYSG